MAAADIYITISDKYTDNNSKQLDKHIQNDMI